MKPIIIVLAFGPLVRWFITTVRARAMILSIWITTLAEDAWNSRKADTHVSEQRSIYHDIGGEDCCCRLHLWPGIFCNEDHCLSMSTRLCIHLWKDLGVKSSLPTLTIRIAPAIYTLGWFWAVSMPWRLIYYVGGRCPTVWPSFELHISNLHTSAKSKYSMITSKPTLAAVITQRKAWRSIQW